MTKEKKTQELAMTSAAADARLVSYRITGLAPETQVV